MFQLGRDSLTVLALAIWYFCGWLEVWVILWSDRIWDPINCTAQPAQCGNHGTHENRDRMKLWRLFDGYYIRRTICVKDLGVWIAILNIYLDEFLLKKLRENWVLYLFNIDRKVLLSWLDSNSNLISKAITAYNLKKNWFTLTII